MKKGNLITLLLLVALGAYLAWSTLASQHHECAVDIEFRGRSNSATASAATEEEAVRNHHGRHGRDGRLREGRAGEEDL